MSNGAEWHAVTVQDLARTLQTSLEAGLSSQDIGNRLRLLGPKEPEVTKRFSALKLFVSLVALVEAFKYAKAHANVAVARATWQGRSGS